MLPLLALVTVLGGGILPARMPVATRRPVPRQVMARIPSGSYRPLYAMEGAGPTPVSAFAIDREPVTRGEYLAFVRANASWRRSAVSRELADRGYLVNWRGDLDPGDALDLRRPVTAVSVFAADTYCRSLGKRLPTVDEWEYVAAASETRADATRDRRFMSRLLDLYARRPSDGRLAPVGGGFRNVYGVRDLHGGAWEWTRDAARLVPDHARHDATSDRNVHEHMPSCASAAIGATDQTNYPAFLRYAFRAALTDRATVITLGFRCAAG